MTERLLNSTLGVKTLLFRPPYGIDHQPETADEVAELPIAQSMGYLIVGARIDPHDWGEPGGIPPAPAQVIVQRVLEEARSNGGNIVLLHDGGGDRTQTVLALPQIIDGLRAAGFQIVPVSDLVGQTRAQLMPPLTFRERLVAHADGLIFTLYEWSRLSVAFIFVLGIGLVSCRAIIVGFLAIIEKFRPSPPDRPDFQPIVSVLIPAYNEEDVIVFTVNSVLESDYPRLEVIVVDDGSNDGTGELLDAQFGRNPAVRIMHQPNSGKPAALSHALAEASSGIIVTIDADTAIEPDAISKLVRHFVNPRVGAVAGNVKVGNRISWLTRWQALEYVTSQNLEKRAFDLLNCIPVVPGALSAWRAEAINDSGGFSADTVAEDTDLTITIRRSGWKIDYEEEAIGWTNAPETASTLIRQRFRWTFGTLQAFWKHRDTLARTKYGTLGWIALPNMFLFQLLLPLFSPVIDLAVSRLAGVVRRFAIPLLAPAAVLYRGGRATLARFLHRIHADRFSDLHRRVHARTARRLVPAVAAPAAAFLLPPDDVLRAVQLGDGRRARQVDRLARRGARSSRASGGAGKGLNSLQYFQLPISGSNEPLERPLSWPVMFFCPPMAGFVSYSSQ